MTNTPKRVAVYLRQSLDVQEGIDRQRARCLALVESRGWELVEVFTDNAVSASKSRDSAQWGNLLALARSGAVDVVVATKLDRLARRVSDVLELQEIGLSIATAEGDIDTTTSTGRFQAVLLSGLAELEADRKGERHREAHADRASRGIPRLTKRAYGWKPGGMELEPTEAEHLATALRNILRGNSIRGEAKRMTLAGETTPRYKTGSGGRPWDSKALTSVLDHPRIAGILVYRGVEQPESKIEPIVSREEWEEYRAIRKDPDRLSRRAGRTPLAHWLSGLPECGADGCDGVLAATTISGRSGKRYKYYRCRKPGPGHVAIESALAEREVAAHVYAQLLFRKGETGDDDGIRAARLRVAEVAEVVERATSASLRGSAVGRKAADKVRREAEVELTEAQDTLSDLLAAGSAESWADLADMYLGRPEGYVDAFDTFQARWAETPVERRREITRSLMRVRVLRDGAPREVTELDAEGKPVLVTVPAKGSQRIVITPTTPR